MKRLDIYLTCEITPFWVPTSSKHFFCLFYNIIGLFWSGKKNTGLKAPESWSIYTYSPFQHKYQNTWSASTRLENSQKFLANLTALETRSEYTAKFVSPVTLDMAEIPIESVQLSTCSRNLLTPSTPEEGWRNKNGQDQFWWWYKVLKKASLKVFILGF